MREPLPVLTGGYMPFKSKSQIRRFASMVKAGSIDKKTFDAWMKETPSVNSLPEKAKGRKNPAIKRAKKASAK